MALLLHIDQRLPRGVGWLEDSFDPERCTNLLLSSRSAGGRTVGRVPPWWTSGGHHQGGGGGIGGTHGMERLVSTSFLGNPLARNTYLLQVFQLLMPVGIITHLEGPVPVYSNLETEHTGHFCLQQISLAI